MSQKAAPRGDLYLVRHGRPCVSLQGKVNLQLIMLPTGSAYAAFEELRPQEMTGYSDIPVGLVSAYDVLSPQEAEAMLRRSTAYSVVDPTAGAHLMRFVR